MKYNKWFAILLLVALVTILTPIPAHADVAPPEQPPGASIVPGTTPTQVRMVAETVTLTVLDNPSILYPGQALTEAIFIMRNIGAQTETMQARFPLTFWNSQSDGFGKFPEISDIQIFINNQLVPTQRIEADFTNPGGGLVGHKQAPWAAFDVSFPPNTDVTITVKYTTNGYGYAPNFALRYILETGAGWNGTIGSADIVIRLPYPATEENVLLTEETGFSLTTPGAQLIDNNVHWHYEDFEPTTTNNITVSLVIPSYWQKVLNWREQAKKAPDNGEVWGQLGKAIKEVIRHSKGYLREDNASKTLFKEAVEAYDKSVTLLPDDALWHLGFADLLWSDYEFRFMGQTGTDFEAMSRLIEQLRLTLARDPNNKNAHTIADAIAQSHPWAIQKTQDGYDFLVLTATPTADPPTVTPTVEASSTPQPSPEPTETVLPANTSTPTGSGEVPVSPTKSPGGGLQICGNAVLLIIPALAGFWINKKRRR